MIFLSWYTLILVGLIEMTHFISMITNKTQHERGTSFINFLILIPTILFAIKVIMGGY